MSNPKPTQDRKENDMPTVFDVAVYFLTKIGPMTTMRLQKLCYYAQAWSLVWEEEPIFGEEIQAWVNGPVCPDLFKAHQGMFKVEATFFPQGNPSVFTPDQVETLDVIIRDYGDKPARWLIDLTHEERPWKDARQGLGDSDFGSRVITHAAMAEFYSGLATNN